MIALAIVFIDSFRRIWGWSQIVTNYDALFGFAMCEAIFYTLLFGLFNIYQSFKD